MVDPVRVEHTEAAQLAASTLLSNVAQTAHVLELVDTLVLGLTVGQTLVHRLLAATTAHAHCARESGRRKISGARDRGARGWPANGGGLI